MLQVQFAGDMRGDEAVCVVRCVGGEVRPGERLRAEGGGGGERTLVVRWIERYGHPVGVLVPPHSARVGLTSDGRPVGLPEGLLEGLLLRGEAEGGGPPRA
ncbi:hypothetical protein ACSNOK_25740 [Streptomyces sp. URMC 126]|uniref:hypothetical protein n=1 Tax=Streptomyces sp. URMC 126 TaxID=3423401 RepID=UPI003F1AB56C